MLENFNNFEISNEDNIIGGCRRNRSHARGRWRNWISRRNASAQVVEPMVEVAPIVEPEIIKPPAPPGVSFSEADTMGGRRGNNTTLVINIDVTFGSLFIEVSSVG